MASPQTTAQRREKPARRRVDGVLLLDKPAGITSNAALQAARRLFGALKAGHAGTLDPLASGLLPIAFGEATKLAGLMTDADKRYRTTIRLGVETDTADAEGRVTARRPVAVDEAAIEAALARFRGEIAQIPPMHSALKREGRPLYELARQGIEVERAARRVRIDELRLVARQGDSLTLDVACSKGTYVRSLAADIGAALGCGAHVAVLRRTASGPFVVEAAIGLDELERMTPRERLATLHEVDLFAAHLPRVELDGGDEQRFCRGMALPGAACAAHTLLRVYAAGRFCGFGRVREDGCLQPVRVVHRDGTGEAKRSDAGLEREGTSRL